MTSSFHELLGFYIQSALRTHLTFPITSPHPPHYHHSSQSHLSTLIRQHPIRAPCPHRSHLLQSRDRKTFAGGVVADTIADSHAVQRDVGDGVVDAHDGDVGKGVGIFEGAATGGVEGVVGGGELVDIVSSYFRGERYT